MFAYFCHGFWWIVNTAKADISCNEQTKGEYFGLSRFPVTVTTRIITFLVGDPYKPSFPTVTGRGDNPKNTEHSKVLEQTGNTTFEVLRF